MGRDLEVLALVLLAAAGIYVGYKASGLLSAINPANWFRSDVTYATHGSSSSSSSNLPGPPPARPDNLMLPYDPAYENAPPFPQPAQ